MNGGSHLAGGNHPKLGGSYMTCPSCLLESPCRLQTCYKFPRFFFKNPLFLPSTASHCIFPRPHHSHHGASLASPVPHPSYQGRQVHRNGEKSLCGCMFFILHSYYVYRYIHIYIMHTQIHTYIYTYMYTYTYVHKWINLYQDAIHDNRESHHHLLHHQWWNRSLHMTLFW